MKRILAFIILSFILLSGIGQNAPKSRAAIEKPTKEVVVFLCDSETAYAYHSSSGCSGLNRCKHEIIKVTKSDAVNQYGRRPCKICY